jgi:hypothetical protein
VTCMYTMRSVLETSLCYTVTDANTLFPVSNTPVSTAPVVNGGFPSLSPAQTAAPPASSAPSTVGGDKYSDLADLFSAPVTTESNTAALNWGGSSSSAGVNWSGGGGGGSSGIDWSSGGGGGSGGTGVNWNSGGSNSAMGTTMSWNSSSSTTSSVAPSSSGVLDVCGMFCLCLD